MAVSMIRAYLFGTGPGDGGAGRAACLRQDAARARGARHRVHVPRHLASSASVVSAASIRPSATASASARRCCIPTAAARSCCARPIRAIRRASATISSPRRTTCRRWCRASSWRARWSRQQGARSLSRRRDQSRRQGADRRRDRRLAAQHRRSPRIIRAAPARWARRPTRCSIRRCACAASSGCAWSMRRRCRISSPRTSMPAC